MPERIDGFEANPPAPKSIVPYAPSRYAGLPKSRTIAPTAPALPAAQPWLKRVVDDDQDRRARTQRLACAGEHRRDSFAIRGDRKPARPAGRRAELEATQVLELEQLVGGPVLLVIVDQPRVRR